MNETFADIAVRNLAFKSLCRHGEPTWADLLAHIEDISMPIAESGCLVFLGGLRRGYGRVMFAGESLPVHVVMYENERGPIPPGLILDHKCRVRACWNADHLEPVTNKVNVLRGIGHTAVNARKTHCVNGHELTGSNLITSRFGWRRCGPCSANRCAQARKRRSNHG